MRSRKPSVANLWRPGLSAEALYAYNLGLVDALTWAANRCEEEMAPGVAHKCRMKIAELKTQEQDE
jgi:hypothetical protein